jgi:hypothetical protein
MAKRKLDFDSVSAATAAESANLPGDSPWLRGQARSTIQWFESCDEVFFSSRSLAVKVDVQDISKISNPEITLQTLPDINKALLIAKTIRVNDL